MRFILTRLQYSLADADDDAADAAVSRIVSITWINPLVARAGTFISFKSILSGCNYTLSRHIHHIIDVIIIV